MAKEVCGVAPFVTLELPSLTGGEDGDNAVPIVGLEVIRRFDENETQRTGRVNGRHDAVDVENVEGSRGCRSGRSVETVHEEGLDVGQAE